MSTPPQAERAELEPAGRRSSGAMLEGNFKGLARLSGNLFLMVTDWKGKEREPTTFLLFTLD